jgi:hypothetical protein
MDTPDPDPEPDPFFVCLTAEGRGAVPANVRLLPPPDAPAEAEAPARTAWSAFHRSRWYLCHDFHRPISRCLPVRRR